MFDLFCCPYTSADVTISTIKRETKVPIVIVTQPSDGQTADANDVNSQIDAILAVLNGNLDSANYAPLSVTNADLAGGITVDKLAGSSIAGWAPLGHAPSSVVANGNKSYNVVFSGIDLTSVLSPGMRLQLTRSTAAPHQCATLNGSSQYFSNASPNGMTFTDKFVVSAWVKLAAYNTSAAQVIVSRYNGTSGWQLTVETTGQLQLAGFNGGSSNFSVVKSSQSIPVNKWVHIALQLDMTDFTATTTTSWVMIDGTNVPASVSRGGTNPTALIQAGTFEVGAGNGTGFFGGEIAQVAVYSAQVTQSAILATMAQSLVGTETSLISAYSFNNVLTDLNANANTLTAQGSAVATTADSPFAQGATAGLLEYGIVTGATFSTNTTLIVQVPEGSAIPTSGGVGTVNYSGLKVPFLFPASPNKWKITYIYRQQVATASNSTFAAFPGIQFVVPAGSWKTGFILGVFGQTTQVFFNLSSTNQTGLVSTTSDLALQSSIQSPSAANLVASISADSDVVMTTPTTYVLYSLGATTNAGILGSTMKCELFAEFGYL